MAIDQERFQKAMALRDSGREEEAIRELRAMAEESSDPDEKAAHIFAEGVCLLRLGRLDEARKCNRRAADVSVSRGMRARTDSCEAVIYWEERKFKESFGVLDKMLKEYSDLLSTPDFRDLYEMVHQRRAILLAEFGRQREARPLLEEALSFQLDADDKAQLLYYLGVALYTLGDKLGAKARFLEAQQDRPDDYASVSSRFYLGVIYSEEGAYGKALHEFEWVEPRVSLTGIPKDRIYGWLARTYRMTGNTSAAERYEKRVAQR
jgi:tetratricopeptide (TPR) repeat protein